MKGVNLSAPQGDEEFGGKMKSRNIHPPFSPSTFTSVARSVEKFYFGAIFTKNSPQASTVKIARGY